MGPLELFVSEINTGSIENVSSLRTGILLSAWLSAGKVFLEYCHSFKRWEKLHDLHTASIFLDDKKPQKD